MKFAYTVLLVVVIAVSVTFGGCGGSAPDSLGITQTVNTESAQADALLAGMFPVVTSEMMADAILRAGSSLKTGPRFNFIKADLDSWTAANVTAGATRWTDPVNAKAGQIIRVKAYVHNGVPGTTARNVRVKITGSSKGKIMTGTISADNATTVSDTVVNGVIVGKPGLTIKTPTPCKFIYVLGSTKGYRDGQTTGSKMLDGIAEPKGVLVGDIQGCWQYVVSVTAEFRVVAQETK